MERLTFKTKMGNRTLCNTENCCDDCTNCEHLNRMLDKLADYEDLEEQCIAENQCDLRMLLLKWKEFFDDIAELYDYRKAEEQGLLLRLPCRVGDTVYHIEDGEIYEFDASDISIRKENGEYIFCIDCMDYKAEDFGRIVFLTEKEAESALAEKGGAE